MGNKIKEACCGCFGCGKEEIGEYGLISYIGAACCVGGDSEKDTWCCPPVDFILNEFLYCMNCCYQQTPDKSTFKYHEDGEFVLEDPILTAASKCASCFEKCFSPFYKCGKYLTFDCWVDCLYKKDGHPEIVWRVEKDPLMVQTVDKLDNLRELAQHGDLIVSGSEEGFAKIIEGLTSSNLNHCAIVIDHSVCNPNLPKDSQDRIPKESYNAGTVTKDKLMVYHASIWGNINGVGGAPFDYVMGKDYGGTPGCWAYLLKLSPESRQIIIDNNENLEDFLKKACRLKICCKKSNRRYDISNQLRIRKAIISVKHITESSTPEEIVKCRKEAESYVQDNNFFYGNCSEFTSGCYRASKIFGDINCSFASPESCTWPDIFGKYYHICLGIQKKLNPALLEKVKLGIPNFRTVAKEGYVQTINDFHLRPPKMYQPTYSLQKEEGMEIHPKCLVFEKGQAEGKESTVDLLDSTFKIGDRVVEYSKVFCVKRFRNRYTLVLEDKSEIVFSVLFCENDAFGKKLQQKCEENI